MTTPKAAKKKAAKKKVPAKKRARKKPGRRGTNKRLTPEIQAFIVRELACYSGPQRVADLVRETFGVEVAKQVVQHYDPTSHQGRLLSKKWRELFYESRADFKKHVKDHIPGANRAVRLMRLERAAVEYERLGNYQAMADMTERQAKEVGRVHTNRREVTGKSGGPIQFEDMTDEQLDFELAQALGIKIPTSDESSDDGSADPAPSA